jgi:hypothetical protein
MIILPFRRSRWRGCGVGSLVLVAIAATPVNALEVRSLEPDRPTVHAVRASGSIVLDGRLDEPAWLAAPVATGFRQVEPQQGTPATFDTEVRLLFDDRYLYVGAFMRDTVGWKGVRVPDLRRDFDYFQNDLFGIALDPFGDARSNVGFMVNPYGALRDLRVFEGTFFDRDWRGVWEARTEVTDSGWTAELRIPWTTLRYPAGHEASRVAAADGMSTATLQAGPPWRVNFVRWTRRLGEETGWSPWPRQHNINFMRYAGTLTGVEPPPPARNLRIQPYTTARANRTGPEVSIFDDPGVQLGGDAKWAITPSTVLDLTVNTDFAEADVDRQVVNLSRFSVFFPERRPFFLENAGLFQIGWGSIYEPFFSRRIGLDATGLPLPIAGGARLVRQAPGWSAGGIAVRQGAERGVPGSTMAVARMQQNLGGANRIGALVTGRYDDEGGDGVRVRNTMLALDGFFRPSPSFSIRTLASGSVDRGEAEGEGWSGWVHLANNARWGYAGWVQGVISRDYDAALGFLPRRDLITTSPALALDLRPDWLPTRVRSLRPGFTGYWYHAASTREFQEGFLTLRPINLQFDRAEELTLWARHNWQVLERPFRPIPGLSVEPGRYEFTEYAVTWRPDLSRAYWAFVTVSTGGFFDGRRDQVIYRASPLPGPHLGVTFDYTGQRFRSVGVADDAVVSHLLGAEVRFALNPRLQLFSFYQRNTSFGTDTWNTRLAWEFRPLSFLYLVFNDGQQFGSPALGVPAGPRQQQLILKASWLGQL